MKIDAVRSSSSGVLGRARSEARGYRLVLDSSSRPHADAFTNSEAFLGGVSSCGVTLIEMHAKESGVPMTGIDVTIEGARAAAEPNRFATVTMTFEIAGVSQAQAEELVKTYRGR
ncbi:MAG: OsmC family protein [Candidatus Rokuibacteriota bacterium]